ncbi:MAG TPA: AAA family ATPase [Thermomicrobiales bacterium]|nr:AAA family ATPase [Thermomicrobiales bacterium]
MESHTQQTTSRTSPRTIALANQKGGVGKTTSAVNIAVELARRGARVLLVDVDPQGNASSSLGLDKRDLDATVYELLIARAAFDEVVVSQIRPSLDLIPANSALAGAEVDLVDFTDRAVRLRDALLESGDRYDVVVIDSPPSLGFLTVNALCAAQHVIVPIQCEYLALEGLGQLIGTIDLVKKQLNPELDLTGVLMTMYDARTRLSAQVVEEVRRYFPQRTFATVVPRSVRLAEAPSFGQAIAEYDAASRGAVAYRAVVDELSARLALGLDAPEPPLFSGAAESMAGQSIS